MLTRTAFTTSRLLEFTAVEELTKLVGFNSDYWPVVAVKELIDNALDSHEDGGIAPEISVSISTEKGTITVEDKGGGIAPETIAHLLDYSKKTSSREAYIGPSRGRQGNALQALLAMPFALDGQRGGSTIISHGIAHHIVFGIDQVRREPKIEHQAHRSI